MNTFMCAPAPAAAAVATCSSVKQLVALQLPGEERQQTGILIREQVERQVICMRLPGARWPLFGCSFIKILFVTFDVPSKQTGNGVSK